MAYLINPPTYLSVAAFAAQANDYSLAGYSPTQQQDLLVRASGVVDSILCRSYLPQEITEEFEGEGTNTLEIGNMPLIFVRSVALVMPGFAPFQLPVGQLMIDYARGQIKSWSPMVFQSLGIATGFPRNDLPVVIDYAYGYNYPIPPPAWSYATAGVNGSLGPGSINFAVTSKTMAGESLPSAPQVVNFVNQGGVTISITPQPGAFTYRIYASQGPNTTLETLIAAGVSAFTPASVAGIQAGQVLTLGFGSSDAENVTVASVNGGSVNINGTTQNAHAAGETIVAAMTLVAESPATNYATATIPVSVTSLTPPFTLGSLPCPLTDTSMWPLPNAFVEATRLIALAILYEQNNLANRGVYMQDSGSRRISWKGTAGMGGEGHPVMLTQATEMLQPYVYRGLA